MSRIAVAVIAVAALAKPAAAFDTWWHAEACRKGMEENGYSADARLAVQVENYITDMFSGAGSKSAQYGDILGKLGYGVDPAYDYLHFDAVFTEKDIEHNWEQLQQNTLAALSKYSSDKAMPEELRLIAELTVLGASLHVVQDFYSHSNWVNYWMKKDGKVPLWYEVDAKDRAKLEIHSGAYPDGSMKGHEDHADLNKDNSKRPFNTQAVDAAKRASVAWLKALEGMDPTLPWDELKNYTVQRKGQEKFKDFLERLDATFLTSSSIVAGHFDGSESVKHVFNQEWKRELVQAGQVLEKTLEEYHTYMNAKPNPFHVPSPYWTSHLEFHVQRDLAAGMLLAGKTYVQPAPDKHPKPAKP